MKKEFKKADIKKIFDEWAGKPCPLCGKKIDTVASWEPTEPGLKALPGDAVFVPLCRECVKTADPDFLEAVILNCGRNIRPDLQTKKRQAGAMVQ
jgi:hypothetical protein